MRTALAAICLVLVAAAATVAQPQRCEAATAAEIDQEANATLHSFVNQTPGARELANKAAGILVSNAGLMSVQTGAAFTLSGAGTVTLGANTLTLTVVSHPVISTQPTGDTLTTT